MFVNTLRISLIVGSFLMIGACSTGPTVHEFADTASAPDEVSRFATDMQSAVERQVDVLSPSAFQSADKSLKDAISDQQKGKDAKDVLHSVAVGRAHLNRATQMSELSRTNMEDVVAARKAAVVALAPKYLGEEFRKADDDLRDVTSNIENNNLGDVKQNRAKLQTAYLDLELKAIKHTNLGSVKANIAQAIKEGAKDYAKQSLAIAEKKVTDTEAFITANRHHPDVKSRSAEAVTAGNHLLKITRASKAGKNVSSEDVALRLESEQQKTQEEKDKLAVAKDTAKDLAVETRGLKSEQAFNASFEQARAEFTGNEAEVYRQGNRLVIRLRQLEFPVNQSVLRGSNFPLLAKVAKVVKGFESSNVVIEGHTDSNGGKEANHKLSTERAQAVSDYLVSSNAIDRGKITVEGFGFERPLATNKTAKGKAQNRRVDVVISPQMAGG